MKMSSMHTYKNLTHVLNLPTFHLSRDKLAKEFQQLFLLLIEPQVIFCTDSPFFIFHHLHAVTEYCRLDHIKKNFFGYFSVILLHAALILSVSLSRLFQCHDDRILTDLNLNFRNLQLLSDQKMVLTIRDSDVKRLINFRI